jgi:hypothetical protein
MGTDSELAAQRLRARLTEGLESGEGRGLTDDVVENLRTRALDSAGPADK